MHTFFLYNLKAIKLPSNVGRKWLHYGPFSLDLFKGTHKAHIVAVAMLDRVLSPQAERRQELPSVDPHCPLNPGPPPASLQSSLQLTADPLQSSLTEDGMRRDRSHFRKKRTSLMEREKTSLLLPFCCFSFL